MLFREHTVLIDITLGLKIVFILYAKLQALGGISKMTLSNSHAACIRRISIGMRAVCEVHRIGSPAGLHSQSKIHSCSSRVGTGDIMVQVQSSKASSWTLLTQTLEHSGQAEASVPVGSYRTTVLKWNCGESTIYFPTSLALEFH